MTVSQSQTEFLKLLSLGTPEGLFFQVSLKVPKRNDPAQFTFQTWAWDSAQPLKPGPWYFHTGASEEARGRKREVVKAVRAIVIDDVGTKVPAEKLLATPTWKLETSPGNFQWGYLIDWNDDIAGADALAQGLVAAGLQDKAVNTACRLFRIPGSINDKPGRESFTARLTHWQPALVYTLKTLASKLKVTPGKAKPVYDKPEVPPGAGTADPLFDWLCKEGYITQRSKDGWSTMRCPWPEEHGDHRDDGGTRYMPSFLSDTGRPVVWCYHEHGGNRATYTSRFHEWASAQGAPAPAPVGGVISEETFAALRDMKEAHDKANVAVAGIVASLTPQQPSGKMYDYITLRQALGYVEKSKLPSAEKTADGGYKQTQPTTAENIQYALDALGVKPRLNLMTGKLHFLLPERIDRSRLLPENDSRTPDMILTSLVDVMDRAGMKNEKKVRNAVTAVGIREYWHPVQDWITSKPWDGVDRLEFLYQSVPTDEPAVFRQYLWRWMLQTVEAVRGWSYGRLNIQKGLVLVLVGKQRIGKTRWLASLMPSEFSRLGKNLNLGHGSRDSKHEALQGAIVELGELDATLKKADIAALKAFITDEQDEYRLPYAESWITRPRCTSFCGSVNQITFLNDPTGSGRFLPIQVTGAIQVDHAIDTQQLWAQVSAAWEAKEQWWLTDAEAKTREDASEIFTVDNAMRERLVTELADRENATKYPIKVIIGAQSMLRLMELDDMAKGNGAALKTEMISIMGKGSNLLRRGANTTDNRWTVNVNGDELNRYALPPYKPSVAK